MGSGKRYLNGKVNWFDWVDADKWSILELRDMIRLLGYKEEVVFYHFKIPNTSLDDDIRALVTDNDVREMIKHIGKLKVIEVFIELWLTVFHDPISQKESKTKSDVVEVTTSVLKKKEVKVAKSKPLQKLPIRKKPLTKTPKQKFVKKLSKKAIEKKMFVFEEWPGGDYMEIDNVEDNIVANDPQNLVVETQCTNDNVVVTEVGQSSGLNRGADESVVVTEVGESSRKKKDDKKST